MENDKSNCENLMSQLFNEIIARTQTTELLSDILSIDFNSAMKLICTTKFNQVICTNQKEKWYINNNDQLLMTHSADIFVGYYLPKQLNQVQFNVIIAGKNFSINLMPGEFQYALGNWPIPLIKLQSPNIVGLKLISGRLSDIIPIVSVLGRNERQFLAMRNVFYISVSNNENLIFGTDVCTFSEPNEQFNSQLKILGVCDVSQNQLQTTPLIKYYDLISKQKLKFQQKYAGISYFDKKYIQRGEVPVNSFSSWNESSSSTIHLQKGENQVNLLPYRSITQIKKIKIKHNSTQNDIELKLKKTSSFLNVKHSEQIATTDLMSCRSMFLAYRDCLTNLSIISPIECHILINY